MVASVRLGALSIGPRFFENVCMFVCLFVCLVNYLIMCLQPLAAYLRNSRVRDPNHPCPGSE